MSNRSVLQKPSHSNQKQKNWFDMSHHAIFSDSIGLLSPVMTMETIPGEKYKISIDSFCRSQAVNTSSFMRIKENYDVFFIPYHQLYSYADQFFSQVSNYNSSVLASNMQSVVPQRLPLFSPRVFSQGGALWEKFNTDDTDDLGYNLINGTSRLFNQLDYGIFQEAQSLPQDLVNDTFSRSPFRFAAYQKVYHDYFQNTDYEDIPVTCFNLDWCPTNIEDSDSRLVDLFKLRYRDRRKDYLTIIKPSFQVSTAMPYLESYDTNIFFGSTASSNNQPERLKSIIGTTASIIHNQPQATPSSNTQFSIGLDSTDFARISSGSPNYALSAQNIRAVLAFEKLSQNVGLGGRDFRSQIESRYGVKLSQLRSGRCQLLGSFDGNVVISEVLATNGDDLGQVGGKGTGSVNGRTIEFEAPEFGILMVIHSFLPFTDYYSSMIDKNNLKCYFLDFYQPELDNLGSQPVYGFEIDGQQNSAYLNGVHGFAPRYIENKTRLNKVYGSQFANEVWTGICTPKSAVRFGFGALKVDPGTYNSQFGIMFDGHPRTDQFICRANFTIHKLSPMSVYGLPNYQ